MINEHEYRMVMELIKATDVNNTYGLWIGGDQPIKTSTVTGPEARDVEGPFEWFDRSQPFLDSKWADGQPDNAITSTPKKDYGQDKVLLNAQGYFQDETGGGSRALLRPGVLLLPIDYPNLLLYPDCDVSLFLQGF